MSALISRPPHSPFAARVRRFRRGPGRGRRQPAGLDRRRPGGLGRGPAPVRQRCHQPRPARVASVIRVIHGGMPGWQIAAIAVAAALVAAAAAVFLDRAWSSHRPARAA